jgi:hypothetical protein
LDDNERTATIGKIPEWACNEKLDILEAFRQYFGKRRGELNEALSNGMGLDTWDPYLSGFSQGMRSGLEIAEDLVYSYKEWVTREVYWPDERDLADMDP